MVKYLIAIFLFFFVVSLWAQPKGRVDYIGADDKTAQDTAKKKKKKLPVFLGRSDISGGDISKHVFDSLLKQGLTARDSAGHICKVNGFMFTYAELKLYEDEVGKLIWLMDYLSEYCAGDTVTSNISGSIYDRTKVGDTLYFDEPVVIDPRGGSHEGKPMRFQITAK